MDSQEIFRSNYTIGGALSFAAFLIAWPLLTIIPSTQVSLRIATTIIGFLGVCSAITCTALGTSYFLGRRIGNLQYHALRFADRLWLTGSGAGAITTILFILLVALPAPELFWIINPIACYTVIAMLRANYIYGALEKYYQRRELQL